MSRIAKLVMVTENNNNKYYYMTENNGKIDIEYGRIGAANPSFTTKSISEWNKTYNSKIKKGYVDQTDILTETTIINPDQANDTSNKFLPSRSESVKNMVNRLLGWADSSVKRNYVVESKSVTQAQVDKAQLAIDEMQMYEFDKTDLVITISELNRKLLVYFSIVPRKMKNVKSYLFDATTFEELEKQRIEKLKIEQDTLDVMSGQVLLNKNMNNNDNNNTVVNDVDTNTDIITNSGLTITEVLDSQTISLIKEKMGDNAYQFNSAFEVRNTNSQNNYNNFVQSSNNKLTDILWHGSANENWWSIITTNLQIRPVASFGRMYGNGNYFASKFKKSYGYTSGRNSYWNKGNENIAVLGLYEVHLGNQKIIERHDSSCYSLDESVMKKQGFDSTHAKAGVSIMNDEFIVYNEHQCTLKYIIFVNA